MQDCGGNLTAFPLPARIYSPGYPRAYDSNQLCRWVITATEGNITVRFLSVLIEESPECEFDNVDVLIGPSQDSVGKMCGSIENHTIATNSSSVTVVFKSDESYEERGFSMEFHAVIDPSGFAEECGDTLVGEEGNVTSPGYPLPYPHKSSCWTLINVTPGRVIVMRFEDLALETDDLCAFDFVEIFDGPSEDSPSFGRFCTESQKRTLRSTSSSVLVHFKSDDLISSRGFLLDYESDSGGIKVSHEGGCTVTSGFENGTVATPDYPDRYPASAHCLLDLEAPREAKVALRFVDFSLEPDVDCNYDFVEVMDKHQDGWRSLGRLCGDKGENVELVTSENRMRLTFRTDNSTESRGFMANFHLVFPQDRQEVEAGNTTTLRNRSLVPADQLMQEIPSSVNVAQDDEAFLNCIPKVAGSSVTWMKDGVVLNGTVPLPQLYSVPPNTLWIRRMQSELAGSYSCVVITKYLEAVSTSVVVMEGTKTRDECEIQFAKSPKDQEVPQGETVVMPCAANVPQRPSTDVELTWLRNGLQFPTSNRYRNLGYGLVYQRCHARGLCRVHVRGQRPPQRLHHPGVRPADGATQINIEEICGSPVVSRPNTTKSQGKIVGGEDTVKGAHPWQVMFWSPSLAKAFCGGTLLNDQWVLSASHCFQHELVHLDEVQVRLGKYDRLEDEPQQVVTTIADVYYHPQFDANTFDNDIALLQLADRVKFTDYILPACLGDGGVIERDLFNSGAVRKGKVTGWGQLAENVNTLPRYLQEIELPIVDHEVCRNATVHKVTENMFCAGYAQEIVGDACQGDSGGPFVVPHKNRWYIVGIVSWGVGCGRRGHYGYYTKVNKYHNWIKEKIVY
ncbi:LOW QUALITY PROTEIN: uncharacterized protein LOC119454094 [Dermacentor silvarum]|uniref:LOW QUALITY PROTEIN: uncharacterized protein LOC119454094 n=1 Tax=Dermacentor silvarum TaxID=543639 RepID=UPI002100CC17|nr:LOW QUALITY PROTEIN: uncharacterized protein LOC119454094 [Dermacentor silvarum]